MKPQGYLIHSPFGEHMAMLLPERWQDLPTTPLYDVAPFVEALRPFAALLMPHHADKPDCMIIENSVTVGDLRRALALINEVERNAC